MAAAKRIARLSAIALTVLLGVVLATAFAAYIALNSPSGRDWATDKAEKLAADAGIRLQLEALSGDLPFDVQVADARLSDHRGEWLIVEDAKLVWHPTALFSGELRIAEVSARAIDLKRPPESLEEEPAQPDDAPDAAGTFPSLEPPLPLQIDDLRVDRLALGAPILGEAATFRIQGAAAAHTEDGIRSELSVERIDAGPTTRLSATAVFRPDRRTLDLDLKLGEAKGGLLTSIAGIPERPPLDLSLAGSGPLANWEARLEVAVAESTGAFDLRLENAERMLLAGTLSPGPFVPPDFRPLTKGGLSLDLDVERKRPRQLRVNKLKLESQAVSFGAQGEVDIEEEGVGIQAELNLIDDTALDALIAPAALKGAAAALTLEGSFQSPRLQLTASTETLSASGLAVGGLRLEARIESDRGFAGLAEDARFSVAAEARDLSGAETLATGLEDVLRGPFDIAAEGRLANGDRLAFSDLRLQLPDGVVGGSATANLSDESAAADLTVSLAKLERLTALTGLELRGAAELDTKLRLPVFDGRVEADFRGALQDFGMGEEIVDSLISDKTAVAGSLRLDPNGALELTGVRIDSERASVEADLTFPSDYASLEVDARAIVPDAAALNEALGVELGGRLDAEAQISGPISDPGVAGTARLERLGIGGEQLQAIEAEIDLGELASGANGRIDALAQSRFGAVAATTMMRVGQDAIDFSDIAADAAGLRASGRLAVPMSGVPLDGRFKVTAASLSTALGIAGLSGDGTANIDVSLSGQGGGQSLRASGDIADLVLNADGAKMTALSTRIDLRLDNLLGDPGLQASLLAQSLSMPENEIVLDRTSLSVEGNLRALVFDLVANGNARGTLDLTGRGSVELGEATEITLAELTGTLLDQPLELQRPLRIVSTAQVLSVRDLDLDFAGGGTAGSFERQPDGMTADLSVEALPLSLLSVVAPGFDMEGTVDGNLSLSGRGRSPTGEFHFRFDGLKFPGGRKEATATARVSGQLTNGRLSAEAVAEGPWQTPLTAAVDLPVLANFATGDFSLAEDRDFSASVDWRGPVEPLVALIPQDQHQLEGEAELALRAEGRLDSPSIDGELRLRDGRYEHLTIGTLLTDLELVVEASDRTLSITRLHALDGNGGKVTGTGQLAFDRAENLPLDVEIRLETARVVRRDEITATASGTVSVSGDASGLDIKGRITVDEAEARLVSNLPPDVVELNVVETRDGEVVERPEAQKTQQEETPIPVRLDILIDMPRKIFIRGRGLDSEWRGNIHIGGTAANPIIEGQLNSVRGRMDLLGKSFVLEPSAVNFLRGPSIDPELDISASHDGETLDVTVRLSGSATNPKLSLSSSPTVPEDEILSRTLFDKPVSQLSAFETAQLAAAVGQLAGRSGPGILDMARSLVGVDVLRVGSTSEGAATVEAGKYLTEEVYIGIEQGAAAESGAVSVEVEVTPNIKLKSDLSGPESSNVGVEFKWDY